MYEWNGTIYTLYGESQRPGRMLGYLDYDGRRYEVYRSPGVNPNRVILVHNGLNYQIAGSGMH
jgi:hypothetical protein